MEIARSFFFVLSLWLAALGCEKIIERTFMDVCDFDTGFIYDSRRCDKPTTITWDHIPLCVSVATVQFADSSVAVAK